MHISSPNQVTFAALKSGVDQKLRALGTLCNRRIEWINRTIATFDQYLDAGLISFDPEQIEVIAEVDLAFKQLLREGKVNLTAQKSNAERMNAEILRFSPTHLIALAQAMMPINTLEQESARLLDDWKGLVRDINSTIQSVNQVSNFQFRQIRDVA